LETVQEGETGWLRPADPAKWAEVMQLALFQLSEQDRKSMGKLGKQRVIAEFSKEKMAERLEKEYEIATVKRTMTAMGLFTIVGGICALAVAVVAVRYRLQS
jgi:alpha-1,3/alpha-1,6-mannosyltransferase